MELSPALSMVHRLHTKCRLTAASPHPPPAHPPTSDALLPASVQTALRPPRRISPAPAPTPAAETPPRTPGSTPAPRSGASPRSTFFPVPPPQPLRLPVAHPHQQRRIDYPPLPALHPSQYFNPSQLPLAHSSSPQSDLLPEILLGDISIEHKRGHYHRGTTSLMSVRINS